MNAFLLAVVVGAQGTPGRPARPGPKPTAAMAADVKPVTAKEAREAFVRVAELLRKTNGRVHGTPVLVAADRVATREEILAEMARLYTASEPAFRFTPAAVGFDAAKFRIDASRKPMLFKLVSRGCIARVGPLAVGPQAGLSPKEFGDALGFFMSQVARMSHLPSPQWTPMLQGS